MEKKSLFGTDGIRGKANHEPMTAPTALQVAMAAAAQLPIGRRHGRVVIGKDTRLSGYMLEPAMTAGFIAMGLDVTLVGPLPTPAVAMLTRSLRCDLGVMISASHNPFEDNGIKLFGADGYKISDQMEAAISHALFTGETAFATARPADLGRARRLEDASGRYIEAVKNTFPKGLRLDGVKIVIDCAHGAAYRVAPAVLYELGAEVVSLGVNPNGLNINKEGGATLLAPLARAVVAERADLGIALDGDADRLMLVDETGEYIDGDQVMALIAASWAREGRLKGGGVVATVMSNLGLERFLAGLKLSLERTAVGDRQVVEKMREAGYNFGGEQSGHLIFADYATTGDGLVAALQVLAVLCQASKRASEVCRPFKAVPQKLLNVRYTSRAAPGNMGQEAGELQPLQLKAVRAAITAAQEMLAGNGRILVRKSGTEALIRIMAEGDDAAMVDQVVHDVALAIDKALPTSLNSEEPYSEEPL
jgi:phosphoglucosamine mutase